MRARRADLVLVDLRMPEVEDGVHDVDRGLPFERESSCEELVEHDAEGEDVASRVDLLPARLLGRHVLRRPDDETVGRERRLAPQPVLRDGLNFREAESKPNQLGNAEPSAFVANSVSESPASASRNVADGTTKVNAS